MRKYFLELFAIGLVDSEGRIDVYKRQSKTYAYSLMREYNKELKAKGYIVAVSYTHLDVYKRQA